MVRKKIKIKVIERKLGKEQAVGICDDELNIIEIDPRQTPKDYLDTLIHERLHIMFLEMSEEEVTKKAKELCDFLWDCNYRRVYI